MKPAAFASERRVVVVAVLLSLLWVHAGVAGGLLETMDREVAGIFGKSKDAVVRIHAERLAVPGSIPTVPSHRVGTGFFVDAKGILITSATVVMDAANCWIEWGGNKVPADLLGCDPLANVAVLHVDPEKCVGKGKTLPFLAAGNAGDIQAGSMVIAIGFAYEQPSAPSVGFVTGFDIKCGPRSFITSHIRAGCRLRPGQGGGPVLNTRGQVIGMAVAAHMDDQCFVLPIHAAKRVLTDLIATGKTQYGWVGLNVTERRAAAHPAWEVQVDEVYSNTPAAQAGFQTRDVLVRIGTNRIERASDVVNTMFYQRAGDRLRLTVVRVGVTQELALVIGQRPAEPEPVPVVPRPPVLPASINK